MAQCFRRALCSTRILSRFPPPHFVAVVRPSPARLLQPGGDFFFPITGDLQQPSLGGRRSFAKGRRSKDEYDGDSVQAAPDIGPTVKSTALSQMEAAIIALSRELSKIRSGRASAGMLDHIIVATGGTKMQLNHAAVVSVIDAQTLSVTPYGSNMLKDLENAIISSPLGINPTSDGHRLIAPIPPLTKENQQAMLKIVAKSGEDVKQSIRRARQKAIDSIKKASSSIPKDDVKKLEKEIEDITKNFNKSADDCCKAKEKEIIAGR